MTNSKPSGTPTGYKLTKEDFKQINRRNLFTFQMGWNYERMQGSGYLYHILPQLRKMYGDNTDELKEMMRTHAQFFNTSNFFNTIVTGIDLAVEEEKGLKGKETVSGIKSGLMGPFAAIGDSIFGSLVPAIFGAIAATLGAQGNPIGLLIWVIAGILICYFRWRQLEYAYHAGIDLVNEVSDTLSLFTNAATLLGVFMVGALIATMVNIQFVWVPSIGEVTIDVQNIFDMIMPRLVPALATFGIYGLLGKKNMTSTKVIFIVIAVSVALSAFGIIG